MNITCNLLSIRITHSPDWTGDATITWPGLTDDWIVPARDLARGWVPRAPSNRVHVARTVALAAESYLRLMATQAGQALALPAVEPVASLGGVALLRP